MNATMAETTDNVFTHEQDQQIARALQDLGSLLSGMNTLVADDWEDSTAQRDLLEAGFLRATILLEAAQEALPSGGNVD